MWLGFSSIGEQKKTFPKIIYNSSYKGLHALYVHILNGLSNEFKPVEVNQNNNVLAQLNLINYLVKNTDRNQMNVIY